MKFIPGGTAVIGVTEEFIQDLRIEAINEISFVAAAYPERKDVAIEPFYLDTHEVTNEQWKAYLDATQQKPSDTLLKEYWTEGTYPKGEGKRPICFISHPEAEGFLRWSLKRLPTEFEWEFAARGPDGKNYPWGELFDDVDPDAKFDKDGKLLTPQQIQHNKDKYEGMKRRDGGQRANCAVTEPIAKREPVDVGTFVDGASPFGIHDLCGNVWEWTSSEFTAYDVKNVEIAIKTPLSKDKKLKFNATSHYRSELRVLRGGAYNTPPKALFSGFRQGTNPDDQISSIGFRGARSVTPGADVLGFAAKDVGAFVFRNTPLDFKSVWAQEHVVYDKENVIRGSKHFAFVPAGQFLKDAKALARLSDMRKEAEKGPVYLGLLSTSVPLANPPMPPGVYSVAFLAKNDGVAKGQKDIAFPQDGWYWEGMAVDPKLLAKKKDEKKKADKKNDAKKEGEPAEGEAAEDEPDPNAEANFIPQPGSVKVDRTRDHVVLLDTKTTIIAAVPIDEPKDVNPFPMRLDRVMVKEDTTRKIAAHERLTWSFGLQIAGKKVVPFTLPFAFSIGAFDAPAPYMASPAVEKK